MFDAETLAFKRSYDISANLHETSSIAYNPADGLWYISDFTHSTPVLHQYDADFHHVGIVNLSTPTTQGVTFEDNHIFLSAIGTPNVIRYNLDGTGKTAVSTWDFGTEIEGIEAAGDGSVFMLTGGYVWKIEPVLPPRVLVAQTGAFDLQSTDGVAQSVEVLGVWDADVETAQPVEILGVT